ncbi:MAG: ATP-dependent helicase HrpB [Bdellovibrionota bacterium]
MATPIQLPPLPIADSIPAIREALAQSCSLVLQAPPGSGKSTIVPIELLDEPWLQRKKILMLQPRRVAARAIAARMSDLIGEKLGQTVGYRVRFEGQVSAETRIEVVTEGILTRKIQEDPSLEGVGLIIFDEFHERSIHADLALALTLDSRSAFQPDLRVLIMSATLNTEGAAALLDNAPIVIGRGVPFPVQVSYLSEDPDQRELLSTAARTAARMYRQHEGDMLVFLPGVGEIKRVAEMLQNDLQGEPVAIVELYGDLPFDKQRQALEPITGRRRIILATPIAETSLTIEGVRIVVDSGLAKLSRFELNTGSNRIVTERISSDSAEQRAGRAGRLGPGICQRLWSEHTNRTLRKSRSPEILESDLASFVLELAVWGAESPRQLRFLDYPPETALDQARALLRALGALDENGRITAEGKRICAYPAHPRVAHMFLAAERLSLLPLACDLAALLDERDIFARDDSRGADLSLRVDALRQGRRKKGGARFSHVERRAEEWARRVRVQAPANDAEDGHAGLLLAFAYPERIAKRRTNDTGELRYLTAGGWGARLSEHDPMRKHEFLVIAHMQVGRGDGKVFLAAPLEERALRQHFAETVTTETVLEWDEAAQGVVAETIERLGSIVLRRKPSDTGDTDTVEQLLLTGLKNLGAAALGWDDDARQLQARIEAVRKSTGANTLPDCTDGALTERLELLLAGRLFGMTKLAHVRQIPVVQLLEAEIGWDGMRKLNELVPESLKLPGGRMRRVDYTYSEGPLFQATVQELFGWRESPKLADGAVPLLLHILSPARRPLQVTRDLASFWKNTYPDVRKEFRGRYPKHKWPEDPLNSE